MLRLLVRFDAEHDGRRSATGWRCHGQDRTTLLTLFRLDSLQLLVHAIEVKAHGRAEVAPDRTNLGNDLIIKRRLILRSQPITAHPISRVRVVGQQLFRCAERSALARSYPP